MAKPNQNTGTVTTKEKEPELTFEDIPMWINQKDKIPVFVAHTESPEIMKLIEAAKYKVYYLIAQEEYTYETSAKVKKTAYRTTCFKVVNNLLGRSISVAGEEVDSVVVTKGLRLNVPKIPIELINKIDSFFRAVDKKLHTESIVVLTFDPSIGGGEGWGFVVPDQENTSTNCDYKPPSIVDRVPKSAFIAGSAHSHPNMSAYASHTDMGDQLDFDGIHITFGWKNGSDHTDYHIEAQMAGRSWIYDDPGDIFSYGPKEMLGEEELEEYMKHVEKKSYAGTGYNQGKGSSSQGTKTGTTTTGGATSQSGSAGFKLPQGVPVNLGDDAPDPFTHLVIGKMDMKKDEKCPFCWTIVTNIDKEHRRCFTCMFWLSDTGEEIEQLISHRKSKNLTVSDFEKYPVAYFMYRGEYVEVEVPESF